MVEQGSNDIFPTQFIKKDFDLSKKIDVDFLNLIKDNFGNDVSVISLALLVTDVLNISTENIQLKRFVIEK